MLNRQHHDEVVSASVIAARLGFSVCSLELARRNGVGPPFLSTEGDLAYHWPSVESWAESRGVDAAALHEACLFIERGRSLLEDQSDRIDRLRRTGGSSELAEHLYVQFSVTLMQLEDYMEKLRGRMLWTLPASGPTNCTVGCPSVTAAG